MKAIILSLFLLLILIFEGVKAQEISVDPAMKQLFYFVGEWEVQQTFHPCSWWPKGDKGTGSFIATQDLKDRFLKIDFLSERENGPAYSSHLRITWNSWSKAYQYWQFSSLGECNTLWGNFKENTYTFKLNGKKYREQLTYRILSENQFELTVENATKENKALQKIITSIYTRKKNDAKELNQLFEKEWESRLQNNPTFASSFGDKRFNDKLPTVSIESIAKNIEEQKSFLKELLNLKRDKLTSVEQLNFDLFRRQKENAIEEHQFKMYLIPISNRYGFHTWFPDLPKQLSFKTLKDYKDYIARLYAFKTYGEQNIALLRQGIQEGYTLPKIVLQGIEGTIKPHIVKDPTKSLLFRPFENFPKNISSEAQTKLITAGKEAIKVSVVPLYQAFLKFMVEEYLPACRSTIGASDLPNGKAFYEYRVRKFTTLNVSPKEIHDIGLAEVKRIHQEMEAIIEEVKFKGSFKEFLTFLRTSEQFYAKTNEELMKEVAYILKKMDGELPKLFKTLPRMSYGIREVPPYIAPKTSTAYYSTPAGDGTRAGFYYVNTYNLKSRPLYEIEALSFHEAVPGHHLQLALQQELQNIPHFRRFSRFTAFVEGWGLYSERLGLEVGFYTDPYRNFGRLTYEMWRACRLVVDTGIHYFGWTREQAIDFMAENLGLTLHNITTEVDRYIAWPGQALAYKMGELKIRELRALAEKELGANFDIREFHEVVLGNGAVPLDILSTQIKNWISKQK